MTAMLAILNPRRRTSFVDKRPWVWGITYGGMVHRVHHNPDGSIDDFPNHVDNLTPVTYVLAIALWAAELYGGGLKTPSPWLHAVRWPAAKLATALLPASTHPERTN